MAETTKLLQVYIACILHVYCVYIACILHVYCMYIALMHNTIINRISAAADNNQHCLCAGPKGASVGHKSKFNY